MKIIIYSLMVWVTLLSNNIYSKELENTPNKQAIQTIKEFYTVYNIALSTVTTPAIYNKKLAALQRKYCTIELLKKIKNYGADHDLLTKDLSTDAKYINTLIVTQDMSRANEYIVSYTAPTTTPSNKPILEKVTIHVAVVKEGGNIKIASVR